MPKKLTFDKWFESQYKKRNNALWRVFFNDKTDAELQNIIDNGKDAEYVLKRRKRWDAMRQAALYAWQARDKK